MAKYGKKTQRHVKKTMRKMKKGGLRSGSGKSVKNRKQAIAIALSESRKKGYKTPQRKTAKKTPKKTSRKTVGSKRRSKKR